jgi:hypothetical protein
MKTKVITSLLKLELHDVQVAEMQPEEKLSLSSTKS